MKHIIKRLFDLIASFYGLLFLGPLIILCFIIATIETRSNGFFLQERIGRNGKTFRIIKIKTMNNNTTRYRSTVTVSNSAYITRSGRFFRRFKLDELPQLINVFKGEMSLVGPRPDVPGFGDKLTGGDRIILSLRPGITGPALLAFRDEEELLAEVHNPEAYNRNVIWPAKVALNREYAENFSFWSDIKYIFQTVLGGIK